jgi:hypothetical protein
MMMMMIQPLYSHPGKSISHFKHFQFLHFTF